MGKIEPREDGNLGITGDWSSVPRELLEEFQDLADGIDFNKDRFLAIFDVVYPCVSPESKEGMLRLREAVEEGDWPPRWDVKDIVENNDNYSS